MPWGPNRPKAAGDGQQAWLTPHALRHSFVTNLLRADVPLHVVASLAGHRDVSTTMRYAAIAVDPLAELLAA